MKKVLALIMALVLVLSLVACQSQEEMKEEEEAVYNKIQGSWYWKMADIPDMTYYLKFDNGEYEFEAYENKNGEDVLLTARKGTYEVNAKEKEIYMRYYNTALEKQDHEYYNYKYDSGNLTLLCGDVELVRK